VAVSSTRGLPVRGPSPPGAMCPPQPRCRAVSCPDLKTANWSAAVARRRAISSFTGRCAPSPESRQQEPAPPDIYLVIQSRPPMSPTTTMSFPHHATSEQAGSHRRPRAPRIAPPWTSPHAISSGAQSRSVVTGATAVVALVFHASAAASLSSSRRRLSSSSVSHH
jgi:hypothetical protein